MITVGICLIYYGVAVWLYQMHIWFSTGHWISIPTMVAWRAGFGGARLGNSLLDTLLSWFLTWPLSLTFLCVGGAILGGATAIRHLRAARSRQRRKKWIAEQCIQAGYKPWAVPKVLADMEDSPPPKRTGSQRRFG